LLITVIVGARPNFMKIARLVPALSAAGATVRIVHTGQHYDPKMSDAFFEELKIPSPDVNLGVGSGSHVHQIAEVMHRLEREFTDHRPDCVVVVGDVNSTVAAAMTASKMRVPLAHVEAGLRSFDRDMPEETNRMVTDALSDWLFTSESSGEQNLLREGVAPDKIHFVGNVMIDTMLANLERARAQQMPRRLGLAARQYAVLTLHRPSNVDDATRLESILRASHWLHRQLHTVFIVHPRTQARLRDFDFEHRSGLNSYTALEPLGYLSMLGLLDSARIVLTDSGGVQEETTALGVPCLTLRENTERPITVHVGTNRLVGWQTQRIVNAVEQVLAGSANKGSVPEKWDGKASERIASILVQG
jgi:UDP-N-acetylglucosamine 2-epimerase (non-hydrolysing)